MGLLEQQWQAIQQGQFGQLPAPTLKERIEHRVATIEATLASVDAMRQELAGLRAALEVMP